jgi:hypothetical protein
MFLVSGTVLAAPYQRMRFLGVEGQMNNAFVMLQKFEG